MKKENCRQINVSIHYSAWYAYSLMRFTYLKEKNLVSQMAWWTAWTRTAALRSLARVRRCVKVRWTQPLPPPPRYRARTQPASLPPGASTSVWRSWWGPAGVTWWQRRTPSTAGKQCLYSHSPMLSLSVLWMAICCHNPCFVFILSHINVAQAC